MYDIFDANYPSPPILTEQINVTVDINLLRDIRSKICDLIDLATGKNKFTKTLEILFCFYYKFKNQLRKERCLKFIKQATNLLDKLQRLNFIKTLECFKELIPSRFSVVTTKELYLPTSTLFLFLIGKLLTTCIQLHRSIKYCILASVEIQKQMELKIFLPYMIFAFALVSSAKNHFEIFKENIFDLYVNISSCFSTIFPYYEVIFTFPLDIRKWYSNLDMERNIKLNLSQSGLEMCNNIQSLDSLLMIEQNQFQTLTNHNKNTHNVSTSYYNFFQNEDKFLKSNNIMAIKDRVIKDKKDGKMVGKKGKLVGKVRKLLGMDDDKDDDDIVMQSMNSISTIVDGDRIITESIKNATNDLTRQWLDNGFDSKLDSLSTFSNGVDSSKVVAERMSTLVEGGVISDGPSNTSPRCTTEVTNSYISSTVKGIIKCNDARLSKHFHDEVVGKNLKIDRCKSKKSARFNSMGDKVQEVSMSRKFKKINNSKGIKKITYTDGSRPQLEDVGVDREKCEHRDSNIKSNIRFDARETKTLLSKKLKRSDYNLNESCAIRKRREDKGRGKAKTTFRTKDKQIMNDGDDDGNKISRKSLTKSLIALRRTDASRMMKELTSKSSEDVEKRFLKFLKCDGDRCYTGLVVALSRFNLLKKKTAGKVECARMAVEIVKDFVDENC